MKCSRGKPHIGFKLINIKLLNLHLHMVSSSPVDYIFCHGRCLARSLREGGKSILNHWAVHVVIKTGITG